MNKQKIKKSFAIGTVFILFVMIVLLQITWWFGGNPWRVRLNLWFHKEEYNVVAKKFLTQSKIQNIALNDSEIINNCDNHPDHQVAEEWSCTEGDYPNSTSIKLKDKSAVLDYLKIPKEEYFYYANFLQRYHLNGIGKDEEKGFVEVEDKLEGLRYYRKENVIDFVVDSEYLSIKKIDSHWFSYNRDWN